MKLLKIYPNKKILYIFLLAIYINKLNCSKELHLADVDAKLDLALSKEEELKDNPAYREVLKSMLLNEEEDEDEKEEEKPVETPKLVVKKVVKKEKTILNSQLNKLLTFLKTESNKDLSYVQENEKNGKSGLGWIFKDWKDNLEKVKDSDEIVFKHLTSIFTTLKDFPKVINYHLEKSDEKDISQTTEDKTVENYFNQDRDYQVVIDETDDAKKALKLFLNSLPEYVTDEDIKELSHHYIDLLKNYVSREENKIKNNVIPKFSEDLEKVKKYLKKGKTLKAEETDALLYLLKVKINEKLEYAASKEGNLEIKNTLKEANLQIGKFQQELEKRINLRKPLKKDFDNLMGILKNKIISTQNLINLKDNVKLNLKEKLKKQLDKEFEEVDVENVKKLTNEFSKNTMEILESKLKKSLSETTIQKVLFNLARSAETDLDNLKDSSKKSDFIWDTNNIDKIAAKASEEIKLLHEKNGKIRFRINLREFDDFVKKATEVIDKDYKPENLEGVKTSEPLAKGIIDSGKYLERLEDDIYNVLTNDDTKEAIEKYSKSYLNKFKTFYNNNKESLDKSKLVNTFFSYIHENENSQATPKRLLNSLVKSESLNSRKLSITDKKSLKYLRHLLLRWLYNYKHNLNYSKIFEKENNHLLDIVYHKALYLGPDLDEALGKNEKRRLSNKNISEGENKKRRLDLEMGNDFKLIGKHFLEKNLNRDLGKVKENLEGDFKRFLGNLGNNEHMKEIKNLLDISNFHLENVERDLNEVISDLK